MPFDTARPERRFFVHPLQEAPGCAHLTFGVSFEDAALLFVEEFHPAADAHAEIALIVEDCDTGERQCFRIDLDAGEAAACD